MPCNKPPQNLDFRHLSSSQIYSLAWAGLGGSSPSHAHQWDHSAWRSHFQKASLTQPTCMLEPKRPLASHLGRVTAAGAAQWLTHSFWLLVPASPTFPVSYMHWTPHLGAGLLSGEANLPAEGGTAPWHVRDGLFIDLPCLRTAGLLPQRYQLLCTCHHQRRLRRFPS